MKKKLIKLLKKIPLINHFVYKLTNIFWYGSLQRKQYVVLNNKKLIYLVNAKVACSSIKQSLINEKVKDSYEIHKKKFNVIYKLNPEHNYFFKFAFVRNPFDRLVSCYESKYHNDKIKRPNGPFIFDKYLFGALKNDKGFENFAKRICLIPDMFADRHFQSQYFQIYKNKKNTLDYVGKFENIAEDFDFIKNKFKLNDLPHYNKSGNKNWMDYYDLKLARKIYKRYKKDFIHFGYSGEYEKLNVFLNQKKDNH